MAYANAISRKHVIISFSGVLIQQKKKTYKYLRNYSQ